MLSEIHYVVRSQIDGQYLVARLPGKKQQKVASYLLVFQEHAEALVYLNTHALNIADKFAVESLGTTQLKGILQRWGFQGIGLVVDPLVPNIDFMQLA